MSNTSFEFCDILFWFLKYALLKFIIIFILIYLFVISYLCVYISVYISFVYLSVVALIYF